MHIRAVEYDGEGNAENDLARLWCAAVQGDRQRITVAAQKVEECLLDNPQAGIPITNGVTPVVRYLDLDILRAYHQIFESDEKLIIIGFNLSP
jgi:hypothetical protein